MSSEAEIEDEDEEEEEEEEEDMAGDVSSGSAANLTCGARYSLFLDGKA